MQTKLNEIFGYNDIEGYRGQGRPSKAGMRSGIVLVACTKKRKGSYFGMKQINSLKADCSIFPRWREGE
jgi:hypothetical protein